jgi:AAA domain/UvrD-like helicase C-terminal domain
MSLLSVLKDKPPVSGGAVVESRPTTPETIPTIAAPPLNSKPKLSLIDQLKAKVEQKDTAVPRQASTVIPAKAPEDTPPPPIIPLELSLIDQLKARKAALAKPEAPEPEVVYGAQTDTLAAQIARAKQAEIAIDTSFEPESVAISDGLDMVDRRGNPISLNEKQNDGVQYAVDGQSYVLTGEAGTGKSTAIQAVCKSLLRYHRDKLKDCNYRLMDRSGGRITAPSIVICAYTRKAVNNVERIISSDFELSAELAGCFQTVHNLLEYSPVMVWSEKQEREVQMFKPQRGRWNPLTVTHVIIEEASMLGLDLWDELRDALQPGVQIIYVGDINQLPPVFGKSIMSYALTKLPIVHLDMVYRQALDNPIIANAHAVLHGRDVREDKPAFKWITGKSKIALPEESMSRAMGEFFRMGLENTKRIAKWKQELADFNAAPAFTSLKDVKHPKTMPEIEAEAANHIEYDPEEDVVLIPFNKNAMGTKQINYRIAQHLGEQRNAEVFEIIAGFEKHYLAIGDKVFCHKMDGKITNIRANMQYMGKKPMKPSHNLSRFGFYCGSASEQVDAILDGEDFDYDALDIDALGSLEDAEDRVQAASHIIEVELESGQLVLLNSAGDFNHQIFQLGYALSVHKSQGSEWRRVFVLFHKNHATMLSRELLYTAMTRAREELVIVARPELIKKAIKSPRIKGNSLKEKIEYFNSGYLDEDIPVTV